MNYEKFDFQAAEEGKAFGRIENGKLIRAIDYHRWKDGSLSVRFEDDPRIVFNYLSEKGNWQETPSEYDLVMIPQKSNFWNVYSNPPYQCIGSSFSSLEEAIINTCCDCIGHFEVRITGTDFELIKHKR